MLEQIELIDRNALIKDIAKGIRLADEWERESYEKKDQCELKHAVATRQSLLAMIERVKEAPIVKAKPVQYGQWIPLKGWFNKNIVKCSVCGNTLDMGGVNAGRGDANFCPNCGADMREGGADNA